MRSKSIGLGRGLFILSAIVLAVSLLVASIWPGTSTANNASESTPSSPAEPSEEASKDTEGSPVEASDVQDVDVKIPVTLLDLYASNFDKFKEQCGSKFDRSSIRKPAKDDAADFVLKGNGKAVPDLDSRKCYNATNPTVTHGDISALINQKTPSGKTFGSLNPWMKEFLDKSSKDLLNWLYKDESGELFVTEEYQEYAFLTWTMLTRLKHEGVQYGQATVHRPLQTVDVNGLPRTINSKKFYEGSFVILAYTQKGQPCAHMTVGINTSDGRIALLRNMCEKPKTTKKPKPPAPKPQPPAPKPQPPAPKPQPPAPKPQPPAPKPQPPAPKPQPPAPKPPAPKPQPPAPKQPAKDPVHKGNSGNGGGKNQNPGPGTYVPPKKMDKPKPNQPINQAPPKPTPTKKPSPPTVPVKPMPKPTKTVDTSNQENHGTVKIDDVPKGTFN